VRIAWSRDLGGVPVDPRITEALEKQRGVFEDLGCVVEEGEPDFSGADEIFLVWRAWYYELCFGELLEERKGDARDFSRYADDPTGFIREILKADPWGKQEEIARALRRSVSAAAALAPDAPEVRRLLALAEQIHP
jgi:Asp-tRNA(Asn)/Glu-tRNA(Gln) amidotransferase A subunit family amidase